MVDSASFLDVSTTTTGRTPRLSGFARAVGPLPRYPETSWELFLRSLEGSAPQQSNRRPVLEPAELDSSARPRTSAAPCLCVPNRFGVRFEGKASTSRSRRSERRWCPSKTSPPPSGKNAHNAPNVRRSSVRAQLEESATASATLPSLQSFELCYEAHGDDCRRDRRADPKAFPHVQAQTGDHLGVEGVRRAFRLALVLISSASSRNSVKRGSNSPFKNRSMRSLIGLL